MHKTHNAATAEFFKMKSKRQKNNNPHFIEKIDDD